VRRVTSVVLEVPVENAVIVCCT